MKKITLLFLALTGMLNVTNAQQTLYSENFESNLGLTSDQVVTFKPSTKAGTWSGGKDLTTTGDANMSLRFGWSSTNLRLNSTETAVTISNINVAGYTNLSLSFLLVFEGPAVAPFIEASADGGAWVTLTTVPSGDWYARGSQSVALPAAISTISLRINPPTGIDQIFDDFKITGTVSLGIGSNELTENSIKVYPNPFASEFNIDATNSEGPLQVSVFDVLGRKIESTKSASSSQLSMGSSLKSGLYIVQVEGVNSNYSKSFKMVKK
ncbi:T9SS type A sorting domain-containing protein [Flavobacterium sp. CF136]|uniref:T9SS type A sorting domain-containing protein n=1 Tax=Flavobacterium sp. (strain CF136) TaxID=1144313 RepID=UPI0002719612|nr:T9SS type A sorting domain-containing protein [Flavobacterium sp. CF136]EJL67213.1 Por secretion system C-terminal sorting domain-containing protein [Flavobacterium sp. CF136]